MSKENKDKDMLVRVQPTLFDKFKEVCERNYKSISEVIREFMVEYIKSQGDK
jgi:metal-responsive CopG/Arc/MetJ family transcriptional regulator